MITHTNYSYLGQAEGQASYAESQIIRVSHCTDGLALHSALAQQALWRNTAHRQACTDERAHRGRPAWHKMAGEDEKSAV